MSQAVFAAAMLDLNRGRQPGLEGLVAEVKKCRDSYRMAASLHRQLAEFGPMVVAGRSLSSEPHLTSELRLVADFARQASKRL
eukprot:scaffold51956_cov19-Prasinocladus_malaysianus.AAC.1